MDGLGDRLRLRAAELGLSGAEVARRAGLTPTRYGHYVKDYREPDLATLVRICRVLGLRPDLLLGYDQPNNDADADALLAKRAAVADLVSVLDAGSLDLTMRVVQAIAATVGLRNISSDPVSTHLREPSKSSKRSAARNAPSRR